MAIIATDDSNYTAIADAIREKTGTTDTYKPTEMAAGIKSIDSGLWDEEYLKSFLQRDYNIGLIKFPVGITKIGRYACAGFTGGLGLLTELPETVTEIGSYAFELTELSWLKKLPSGLTEIGDYAFTHSGLKRLTELPSTLDKIGRYAFSSNDEMVLTELPSGLTEIGMHAFEGCKGLNLTSISATEIGTHAFSRCTGLQTLSLDVSVLNDYAFSSCTGLTEVIFTKTPFGEDWGAQTPLGEHTFQSCTNLTSIKVPWGKSSSINANAPWGATNATITYGYTG